MARTCKHYGGKAGHNTVFCFRMDCAVVPLCECNQDNCAYWVQKHYAKDERTKQRIYDYIAAYIHDNSYPPAIREICEGVGLKSTSSVHRYLQRLKQDGMIDFKEGCPRTIQIKV